MCSQCETDSVAGELLGAESVLGPRTDTDSPTVKEELRSQTHVQQSSFLKREREKKNIK